MRNPLRYFNSSSEVVRLAVMMCVRCPLPRRQVEDLPFERGIDVCHETVRFRWHRFGPLFAAVIGKRRVHHHSCSNWPWHLDEVFVRINGETHYLWRAVDHEGEGLESGSAFQQCMFRPNPVNWAIPHHRRTPRYGAEVVAWLRFRNGTTCTARRSVQALLEHVNQQTDSNSGQALPTKLGDRLVWIT